MESDDAVQKLIIKKQLEDFLEDDLRYGDISSSLIPNKAIKAEIRAKSPGFISGITEACIIFEMFGVNVEQYIKDGTEIKKGDIVLSLTGNLRSILAGERTALNILMRMSAITTSTKKMVKQIEKEGLNVRIAATRKTTPGFRFFEKRAVIIGGGDPHRWRLDDMVMLKDTHLDASEDGISSLIKHIRQKISFTKKIEIEVESANNALEAAEAEVDIIMFDNMRPESINSLVDQIKSKNYDEHKKIPLFEASGNITEDNFMEYAKTGIDVISTSEITMFPQNRVDLSLKIKK